MSRLSKFGIGQRVRLKYNGLVEDGYYVSSDNIIVPVGAAGTIAMGKDWEGDYEVMFDLYPCPTSNDPAWFVNEDYLEPIYDGDEKSSWEECLWKPIKDNVPLSTQ